MEFESNGKDENQKTFYGAKLELKLKRNNFRHDKHNPLLSILRNKDNERDHSVTNIDITS